jgi:cyclopropane-fatty-acyl-phospholipid synthase
MASKEDVQFHYDVNNDFFKLFLDKKYKVYSCGVWDNAQNLEEAQENKLKRIADFAHIEKGDQVLDIGCGWGGMLDFCINSKKVSKAVGLTLSQFQYDYILQNPIINASIQNCSWSDFETNEKFDAIVSIGAMEHFASLTDRKQSKQIDVYRNFFKNCSNFSTEDAYLGLQTIVTIKKPDTLQSMKDTYYLLKHVFPGSVLPEINEIQMAMHTLYEPYELRTIGLDYAKTLIHWKERLYVNQENIMMRYGKELWDHYNHYFDAARRSFENGYTSLLQMSLRKIS